LRVVERAVAIEKIVEVEVQRVTENPTYVEKITQRKVPFDQIIEQKYEVIVQNVIEVPVEKEIHVVVKTYTQVPVESRNYFEKDVNVTSTVIEPVQGREVEVQSVEFLDEELAQRLLHNQQQIGLVL
jgi:transglutaminase-like putative cysteine protease